MAGVKTSATIGNSKRMISRAKKYINTVRWQMAKTYEEKAPHEYTVREWRPDLDDEFVWFALYIREVGVEERFWGRKYKYFYLDGYRYWTMGAPIGMTIIINRCKADQPRQ